MTYKQAYEYGIDALFSHKIVDNTLDARLLLEWICQTKRHHLLAHGEDEITIEQWQQYQEVIRRRGEHIPLQYITNEQEFMGLLFKVNEKVLIPRQDTEFLVEEALLHVHDGMKVLDICTGSGCILLSIMSYTNNCVGVGVDLSLEALEVARENAKNLKIQATFLESDLLDKVEGKYDVIISNPPYIPSAVIPTLMEEVKHHEPLVALDGREDGLYFYKRLVEEVRAHMNRGAYLLFEIGHDQGEQVAQFMIDAKYKEVEIKKDYAGNERVVKGFYSP
ncbi:MAG: peptide chain release factor N(5)-glutamine methyltransferase [Eubacteriales bacterium]